MEASHLPVPVSTTFMLFNAQLFGRDLQHVQPSR
ncbi:UNVERIFIED_ORG: hypothetical protein J2W38_006109 [Variovorax paradoxus]|nr:hypothetical protein [Variovorax paradoxus]